MKRLAILGYHKIGPPPRSDWSTWFFIPEETFLRQLMELQADGWQVIDLATFLRGFSSPDVLPERSALITFDDGYRSMLTIALPLLRQLGLPSVLFVPTEHVAKSNSFDSGLEPDEMLCDWDELRKLHQAGVAIQSHAASHRRFSKMDLVDQKTELLRSKAAIEAEVGGQVSTIAFPYGDDGADPQLLRGELERAGYQAAFLYGGGPVAIPIESSYRLTRLAMGPETVIRTLL
jgi:peptidoglycan/xylan/chitin deacetylase (PgdA/CDA1 family)